MEGMADDLDRRFASALREAVQEQFGRDSPKLAQALMVAGEYMRRNRGEVLRQLEEMGVYAWTKEQREKLLELVAGQLVKDARAEADRKTASFWSTWSAKVGIAVGLGGFAVLILNNLVALWQRIH